MAETLQALMNRLPQTGLNLLASKDRRFQVGVPCSSTPGCATLLAHGVVKTAP